MAFIRKATKKSVQTPTRPSKGVTPKYARKKKEVIEEVEQEQEQEEMEEQEQEQESYEDQDQQDEANDSDGQEEEQQESAPSYQRQNKSNYSGNYGRQNQSQNYGRQTQKRGGYAGKSGGNSNSVRLTGLFAGKKEGLFTGRLRSEDIENLMNLLGEAQEAQKEVAVFLWENQGRPEFSLTAGIAQEFKKKFGRGNYGGGRIGYRR